MLNNAKFVLNQKYGFGENIIIIIIICPSYNSMGLNQAQYMFDMPQREIKIS